MKPIVLITLTVIAAAATAVPRAQENVGKTHVLVDEIIAKRAANAGATVPVNSPDPNPRLVIENFFTTKVDHFNPQNAEEWTLRYFSMPDFYRPGGPILIFLGGWTAIVPWMIDSSSLIYEIAEELHGAVYAFESRFYGESKITENMSTDNLRLLSTDQILADLAEFVTYLKRTVLKNEFAHVLVAGAEYGGGLATWFRVRYPHLADAAWASSGYQNAIMDFQEFSESWGDSLIEFGSQECYNEIFVAFHVMQNLIDVGLANVLFEKFNICTEIVVDDRIQVMYFFYMLMTSVEIYTLQNRNISDFAEVCDDLTAKDAETAVDAFAKWFNTKFVADLGCVVVDLDEVVEHYSQIDWESDFYREGVRQQLYQKCTEFGWFITTDSDFQPFGNRVMIELHSEICQRVFGDWQSFETMYYGITRANNRFGADSPATTQIHLTNGAADPWRRASITHDLNPYALADVIPRELSSSDIRAISDTDSEELLEVKRRIKSLVASYLFPVNPRTVENVENQSAEEK
ncbi:thymus-specific serine protease-like [Malaya genurostris]|uniref:thymus-specific serine protease-like n=1 Tax=Malaya genurostris TaxID=325434 RepID=UPI0026F37F1B|nr:thymus-specific serine protease-like [Malaya genurostris]XP_058454751.1 thymus-specific serine protease-like [Malaya genurostris]